MRYPFPWQPNNELNPLPFSVILAVNGYAKPFIPRRRGAPQHMSERAEKIAQLIERRKSLAARCEAVQQQLATLSAALATLEQQRDELLRGGGDELREQLRDIDFSAVREAIAAERQQLEPMRQRFSRETLNLGVVGRPQQGKSRLLQSLSGLGPAEIPDDAAPACTAVRSTIVHNPDALPYGDVWFYSARSFLKEVVAPYYQLFHFPSPPERLDEFAGKPLPPLPDRLPVDAERVRAAYHYLKQCRQALEKHYMLLTTPSPRRVPIEQMRTYVTKCQMNGKQPDTTHLMVRETRVVCSFPHQDARALALIDLPGIDVRRPGEWESWCSSLPYETEVLLLVRMPTVEEQQWDAEDLQIANALCGTMANFPCDRWIIAVLNHTPSHPTNGDNIEACHRLFTAIAHGGMGIEKVRGVIADVANPDEVHQHVLDTILSDLEEHLPSLDAWFISAAESRLRALQQRVRTALEQARSALGAMPATASEFSLFQRLFRERWDALTAGLERLLKQLHEERNNENLTFREAVWKVLEACRWEDVLPSLEAIELRRGRFGSYEMAYKEYLHELRTHLARHLTALDDGLRRISEHMKEQVAAVLVEDGRMGTFTAARGVALLSEMAESMLKRYESLRTAFRMLSTIELSYRQFIQYRIRRALDELTPDLTSLALSPRPSAREVQECLRTLYHETLYRLRIALTACLSQPNEAIFAIVEEFADQALRAPNRREEWEQFYYEVRNEVWATEFQRFAEQTILRQRWQEAIEQVAEINNRLPMPGGESLL